jgi:hypothetical protein
MYVNDQFMLPLFGLWQHTADGLPPSGAVVVGYKMLPEGGSQVALVFCEYEVDEEGDMEIPPHWYMFGAMDIDEEGVEIEPPIAWCQVQFNFPSSPLGQCDDCGGYYKGLRNPCEDNRDD